MSILPSIEPKMQPSPGNCIYKHKWNHNEECVGYPALLNVIDRREREESKTGNWEMEQPTEFPNSNPPSVVPVTG